MMFEAKRFEVVLPVTGEGVATVGIWLTPVTEDLFHGADGRSLIEAKGWFRYLEPQVKGETVKADVRDALSFDLPAPVITWRHLSRNGWWALQRSPQGYDQVLVAQQVMRQFFGTLADVAMEAIAEKEDLDFYWRSRVDRIRRHLRAWGNMDQWSETAQSLEKVAKEFWAWLAEQVGEEQAKRMADARRQSVTNLTVG